MESVPTVEAAVLTNGNSKPTLKYNNCSSSLFCGGCSSRNYTGLFIGKKGMYNYTSEERIQEYLIHNKDIFKHEEKEFYSKRYYKIFYISQKDGINEEDNSIIPYQHNIHVKKVVKFKELNPIFNYSKIRCIVYLIEGRRYTPVYSRDFSGNSSMGKIPYISNLKYTNCDGSLYCKGCKPEDFPDDELIHNKDIINYKVKVDTQEYYEIHITCGDNMNEDGSALPASHNIRIEQYKTMEEVETHIGIYGCGGCNYIVYSITGDKKILLEL